MANQQMFQDAHNLLITGGHFSQTQQNFYGSSGRDVGLHTLQQHIATDAIYDAAERFPPPKCHPGTREKIIKTIVDWINDPQAEEQALWLYGPAGAGKSAIAQSIAMLLQEISQDGKYAGSFFFAKGAPGRGDGNKLFSTIAYQLAIIFPSFRAPLDAVMLEDPTLLTKSIEVQLRHLIIEPLKRVRDWPSHHPTVIIDGLDECSGSKRIQSAILTSISKAITEHHIPLRFLIVSRPEYWISDCFEDGPFSNLARILSLRDDTDADAGIQKYLQEEFDRIYEENSLVMSSVTRPWPPHNIIKRFVNSASGQFIYASTVVKFVGDSSDFSDPRSQLHTLQTPGPHYASAFSELDKLYATILSLYPRMERMKRVLGGIMCDFDKSVIQEFLGVESGEYHLVLRAISSLIHRNRYDYPDRYRALEPTFGTLVVEANAMSFCHLSFMEFLCDESRSGRYAINKEQIRIEVYSAALWQGCDMLQDRRGIEDIISHTRVSKYQSMLVKVMDIGFPMGAFIDSMTHLESTLQTVLAQEPVHIPHAAHALCFANAVCKLLWWFFAILRETRKEFNVHKRRLRSIAYALDNVIDISTEQLMKATPSTATPVLAYLASHTIDTCWTSKHLIEDIKKTMDISLDDIVFELRQLQGLVYVNYSWSRSEGVEVEVISRVFTEEVYKHLPHQQTTSCDVIRLRRVAGAIARILDEHDSDNHSLANMDVDIVISGFIEYRRLSDIHSKDDFDNADKMAVYNLILEPRFLAKVRSWMFIDLIVSTLCWLNRQMTGTTKTCIDEHNRSLLQKMQSATKNLFQNAFLPHFTNIYSSTLCMTRPEVNKCIYLNISTMPDGTCLIEEETRPLTHDVYPFPFNSFPTFADKVPIEVHRFNNAFMASETSGVISPSDWYPHLAAFLLTMLVRCQYGTPRGGFEAHWAHVSRKFFLPLIECMPYAIPTQNNLNSVRALHYLCPRIKREWQWRPPFGFCSLAIDFLRKYGELSLSQREFARLQTWLTELRTRESKRIMINDEIRWDLGEDDDEYTTDEDSG